MKGCIVFQQQKDGNQKRFGIPQPLQNPKRQWGSISTNFIVQFPKTGGELNALTTWVDRLSRRVHFIHFRVDDTAEDFKSFVDNIFKLHGLSDNIVSNCDPKLTSKFWSELLSLCGIMLRMSTSRHPQTDGLSEVANRMFENYLRFYCALNQKDWDDLLPAA